VDKIHETDHLLKSATLTMLLILFLLFWIPVFGALIAGFAGGKKARSMDTTLLALIFPSIVFMILLYFMASYLEALPVFGIIARQGGLYIALIFLISLLTGACLGVAIGKKI
jgi:hypothetical protein